MDVKNTDEKYLMNGPGIQYNSFQWFSYNTESEFDPFSINTTILSSSEIKLVVQ